MSTAAPPEDLDTAIEAARALTALAIDKARPALSYDPIIGEQALVAVKPSLLSMDAHEVQAPNFDPHYTAVVARDMTELIDSAKYSSAFAKLTPELMGEATTPYLRDLAQALFFLESRTRSAAATKKQVRVEPQLVRQASALRERMLRVLTYHFFKVPEMMSDLASIRASSGYMNLASALARLATHYSAHRAALSKETVQYDPADESLARGVSNEIMAAMRASPSDGIQDLRNRCWTKTYRLYAKLRLGAELALFERPQDFQAFPPLRQAVIALTRRNRAPKGTAKPSRAEADAPAEAVVAAPPAHAIDAGADNPGAAGVAPESRGDKTF